MEFDEIAQKPMFIKLSIITALILLVNILAYGLIFKNHIQQWNHLRSQELSLKSHMEKRKYRSPGIQAYRNQLHLLREKLKTILKQLPSANEVNDLLEELTKTGSNVGLKLDYFIPQTIVSHDFYTELPIKISVSGTYAHLATFVSRVAEMKRMINFQELSIKNNTFVDGELMMTLVAKIYSYKEPKLKAS